jgi:alpha-1,2-mannosyltransferase
VLERLTFLQSADVRWPIKNLSYVCLLALIPTLSICIALLRPVDGWLDQWGYIVGRDFVNFWMAARLTAEDRLGELYNLTAYHEALRGLIAPAHPFMNFSYMPNTLPLIRPLGALPHGVALAFWQCASLAAFLAAATGRLWPVKPAHAVVVFLSPAVILAFSLAQATLLIALLFVGAFRLLPDRPILAGMLFGLMTIKPQMGLLIPFVLALDRQWTAIAAAAVTATMLAGLSVLLYGLEPWQAYFANTVPYQQRVIEQPFGLVWALMVTPYTLLAKSGIPQPLALKIHVAIALMIAAVTLYVVRRTTEPAAKAALVSVATVLMMPYCLAYDLAIPVAALIWYFSARERVFNLWQSGALVLFWAMPVIALPLSMLDYPVFPAIGLAFFASLAWSIYRPRVGENATTGSGTTHGSLSTSASLPV